MPDWFITLKEPAQAAIISGLVSIVAALIVAFFNPLGQRHLEFLKAKLNEDYNGKIEELKLTHQTILERLKSDLKRSEATEEAWQAYAFEARKALYSRFEPLLFQLSEVSENSYYRAISLVRSSRQGMFQGKDAWLSNDSYYLRSTIYFLFAPGVVLRLMRQAINFVDLKLDPEIRIKYYLCKMYAWSFTDDFVFAKLAPPLRYDPESISQISGEQTKFSPHYKQGLYVGHLESVIDGLTIKESERQRLMTFGEFENTAWNQQGADWLEPAKYIFLDFDFSRRPVLGRMILSQAIISRLILYSLAKTVTIDDLKSALRSFCSSQVARDSLQWWKDASDEPFEVAVSYVEQRLSWISTSYYDVDVARKSQ